MAKHKRPAKSIPSQPHGQMLSTEQIGVTREVNYIIKRAQHNDARVIRLGSLVLYSTNTGDTWLLDPEDNLALCLARDGEGRSFTITENAISFGIEWNANYRIDGNAFVVAEHSGQIKTILGYPTREILRRCAARCSNSHKLPCFHAQSGLQNVIFSERPPSGPRLQLTERRD